MGNVAKRPNGKWRARYRDLDGREVARHFDRKGDAERWLSLVTSDLLRGQYVDPARSRQTFDTAARRWLDAQTLRPNSRRTYDAYLRNQLLPAFGRRALGSITPTDVRGFLRAQSTELSPSTLHHVHGLLSTILQAAVDDGFLAKNPCARTAPGKPARVKVVPLTVDEVHALTDAMPERYRAMVTLAAGCGLRIGEVLGLRRDRVRFLEREVHVVEQLVLLPGAPPYLAPPKTASSVRVVPLPGVVADALAAHFAAYPGDETDLVFRSRTGGPIWPNTFAGNVWRPARARAGLPGVRFHSLRHFFASALIAAGESVKTVQAAMGHASALETLERYAGLWPDAPDRTRAAIDGVLGGPRAAGRIADSL